VLPAAAAILAALALSLLLSYPSASPADGGADGGAGGGVHGGADGGAGGSAPAGTVPAEGPASGGAAAVKSRATPRAPTTRLGKPGTENNRWNILLIGTPRTHDRALDLDLESLFVLPGGVRYVDAEPAADARLEATGGALDEVGPGEWRWIAPEEPGRIERLTVRAGGDSLRLHAFVLVPRVAQEDGRVEGYRIGSYPAEPLRGNPIYDRPKGFVKVTAANEETHVSPRFQLRHFPAKQGSDYPKFVVLRPELLTKLEVIVDALADRGYPVRSLHVMSGYRTPYYNRRIGNVRYSRHQWGGAADIFVDERPRDGRMDDLNDDGRSDVRDARILYQVVDSLDQDFRTEQLLGGLGLYRANRVRGPFVHVDVRGEIARW